MFVRILSFSYLNFCPIICGKTPFTKCQPHCRRRESAPLRGAKQAPCQVPRNAQHRCDGKCHLVSETIAFRHRISSTETTPREIFITERFSMLETSFRFYHQVKQHRAESEIEWMTSTIHMTSSLCERD
jgi:hypothetical protein